MKSPFIFILLFFTSNLSLAQEIEKKLATLQIERAGLIMTYGSRSQKVIELDAKISALSKSPGIFNASYYDSLNSELNQLRLERSALRAKLSDRSPQITTIDAKLDFIEKALKSNTGEQGAAANP